MCKKKDCIYHTPNNAQHECNYIFITGDSKIGGMPKGERYSVDTCPYYQRGTRAKARKESPIATPNNIRVLSGLRVLRSNDDKALEMYESGMNDIDIAKTFGVAVNTIAKWRRRHNLKAKKQKSIDWDGVDDAFKQGFTGKAISRLYGLEICAVEIYAERKGVKIEERELEV